MEEAKYFICPICKRLIYSNEGKNKVLYITESNTKEICFDCDRDQKRKEFSLE